MSECLADNINQHIWSFECLKFKLPTIQWWYYDPQASEILQCLTVLDNDNDLKPCICKSPNLSMFKCSFWGHLLIWPIPAARTPRLNWAWQWLETLEKFKPFPQKHTLWSKAWFLLQWSSLKSPVSSSSPSFGPQVEVLQNSFNRPMQESCAAD